MKIYKAFITLFLLITTLSIQAQTDKSATEIQQITKTLLDYIEGTGNGEPERVTNAFHKDLNLYSVANDSVRVWNGQNYISGIKKGAKNNRQGRIVSIDYENNAAMAKVEIVIPNRGIYTDYFLLLKYQDQWKIIHKSYTSRAIPE